MLKRLESKYLIAVICKISIVLTTFCSTIFINRGLGVSSKGEYAYIINIVEVLYVFLSFGIGQTYSTFLRNVGDRFRGIFISLSLVHAIIILVIGYLIQYIHQFDFGLTIVFLTALSVSKIIISMIAVIEDSIKRNVIQSLVNTGYLFVLALLYYFNFLDIRTVFLCYGFNELIRIMVFMYCYRMVPNFNNFTLPVITQIYKTGFITMIVMVLITINYSIDAIMLKMLSNQIELGLYSVGVTFSNMFLLIPDSFKEVLFGDTTKKNFKKSVVFESIKISVVISVIILLSFIFFGKFIITLLYGMEFVESYKLTLVIFIGSFSLIFFKILQPVYISYGKQKKAAAYLALSALANICINFVLIPKFQSLGASVATALSYSICGLLFLIDFILFFKSEDGVS